MLLHQNLQRFIDDQKWLRQNITQCSFNRINSSKLDYMGFLGIVAVAILSVILFIVLLLVFLRIRKVWNFGCVAWVYDADNSMNGTYQVPYGFNKKPHQDQGFFSWISAVFHLKYSDIYKRCGQDAQHYLSFQRHLIYFLAVASIISPCVLIPLNMMGTASTGKGLFIKTTMANIRERDEFLWPHFIMGLILSGCMIGFIRKHSSSIHEDEDEVNHMVFIHRLPQNADKETIKKHFNEAYPSCKVERIHMCRDEYKKELKDTCQSHIGSAYVTFSNNTMVNLILKDFNAISYYRRPQSSVSDQLKISHWSVPRAHYPEDILWKNMSVCGWKWWARYLCINGLLFTLLLYLTTPEMIVTNLDMWKITKPFYFLDKVLKYFPALSLWIFSVILKSMVLLSTPYEAHWFKSTENRMIMYKMFSYLIFIVLIAPSLGLNSLYAFFEWLFTELPDPKNEARLECLFWPSRGAVVIHYVIIATFVGNAMDLVRIPEFLWYIACMASVRSTADRLRKMETQANDFSYGGMYANILCVITVVMAYSNISPLVVPCGLLYMSVKHLIDTHNLYYVHLPTKQDRSVHNAAVGLSIAAPIFCLTWQFLFCVLRRGWIPLTVIQGAVLLILIMYSLIKALTSIVKHFSPCVFKTNESYPAVPTSISREDGSEKSPVHSPSVVINIEMEEEQQNTNASEPQGGVCNFYKNYPLSGVLNIFTACMYKTKESYPASPTSISREDGSEKSPVHSPSVVINIEMEEEQHNTNASEPQGDVCNFYKNYPLSGVLNNFTAYMYKTNESYPSSPTSISREDSSEESPVHSPSVVINIEMEEEQHNTNAFNNILGDFFMEDGPPSSPKKF
ncbi:CSC1-like protein 1 [Rana temporaria]|uniref:CSC1-like protein 1 n=1 Tax=Rana temporaria TaxID=8407 RepID=UPI001AACF082|nr:CSC1-like protein 1 [Rana temporaria]